MLLHPESNLPRKYHPSKGKQWKSRHSYTNQAILRGADCALHNPILVLLFFFFSKYLNSVPVWTLTWYFNALKQKSV